MLLMAEDTLQLDTFDLYLSRIARTLNPQEGKAPSSVRGPPLFL